MTEQLFKTSIAYLTSMYSKITDDFYKILWDALKKYSDEEFKQMVSGIVTSFVPTSQVPFPLPPHFLKATTTEPNNRAIIAVKMLKNATGRVGPYKSVSFGDRALHETINHFGGWIEVCKWHDEEWGFKEKKFIETYLVYLKFDFGAKKLIGIAENDFIDRAHSFTPELKAKAEENIKTIQYKWACYKPLLEDKSGNKNIPELDDLTKRLSEGMSI